MIRARVRCVICQEDLMTSELPGATGTAALRLISPLIHDHFVQMHDGYDPPEPFGAVIFECEVKAETKRPG